MYYCVYLCLYNFCLNSCDNILVFRFNKYVKTLCRDVNRDEINLANTTQQDVGAYFLLLQQSKLYDISQDVHHKCTLTGRRFDYNPTKDIIDDLCHDHHSQIVDSDSCVGFPTTNIMGTPFTAGEWPQHPRCGSVITVVKDGRSIFARVIHFFQVIDDDDDHPGYVHVHWFGEPTYLYVDNPLGTKCSIDGSERF